MLCCVVAFTGVVHAAVERARGSCEPIVNKPFQMLWSFVAFTCVARAAIEEEPAGIMRACCKKSFQMLWGIVAFTCVAAAAAVAAAAGAAAAAAAAAADVALSIPEATMSLCCGCSIPR